MKQATREEYERAVALARAAIRAEKDAPRIRADRSPQAVLAKMQAKQAEGEALTEADFGAMQAALAEQESRKQRGPGRPTGTRNHAALKALQAAIYAVQRTGLKPYRNPTGQSLSQCDAIGQAMTAEGFRVMNSYDAARREMIPHRRRLKGFRGVTDGIARQMQEIGRNMSTALDPVSRQVQEMGQAFAALGERIRTQTKLRPETLRAIENKLKTRR